MAFVYEEVRDEDKDLWISLGFNKYTIFEGSTWCVDRQRNAYLLFNGKMGYESPFYYYLWWRGSIIEILAEEWHHITRGNEKIEIEGGIVSLEIPDQLWEERSMIEALAIEAVESDRDSYSRGVRLKPVKMRCKPERVVGGV